MKGIYKIQNKVNGKIYIGQSKDIEKRWNGHRKMSYYRSSSQGTYPLYEDMDKYGIDQFDFAIIESSEEWTKEELTKREAHWVHYYDSINTGYNQVDPLKWMPKDNKWSKLSQDDIDEIIRLLSYSKYTQTQIAKMFHITDSIVSNINTGETHHKENINYPIRFNKKPDPVYCSRCGKRISYNTKHGLCTRCYGLTQYRLNLTFEDLKNELNLYQGNMSEIGRKYNVSANAVKKYCKHLELFEYAKSLWPKPKPKIKQESPLPKPVYQIDPNTNEIIARFESTREAERAIPDAYAHIAAVCKGRRQTAGGYKWKYANDDSIIV